MTGSTHRRRSRRDWIVDSIVFVLAIHKPWRTSQSSAARTRSTAGPRPKLDLNNRVQIALLVHDAGLLHS
jgi:hypothetical protein